MKMDTWWGWHELCETQRVGNRLQTHGKSPWGGDMGLPRLATFKNLLKHLPFLIRNICQKAPLSPW